MTIYKKIKKYVSKTPFWKLLLSGIAFFFSCLLVGIIGFYFVVKWGLFGAIPDYQTIKEFQNNTASEIYSEDNVLLGKYYFQDRTDVSFEDISPNVINALIATEDARFYEHDGVDRRSLLRVIFKTVLLLDESSGGGSTITQQLAKNIFHRGDYGILSVPVVKVKEAIIAKRIEEVYSKKEIITLYLNTVPFGENAFGVETAAERYFSTAPDKLNTIESAVLVGMLKANTTYNPRRNPNNSLARRNVVLSQMVKYDYLEREDYDSLKNLPIELKFRYESHNEGLATYFREHLRQELLRWAASKKKPDGSSYNLYTDGLKIYTTINATMQKYAEEAVSSHMQTLQDQFYAHWKGKRPWYKDDETLISAIYKSKRYQQLEAEGLTEVEIQEVFKKPVRMTIFTWKGEEEVTMSPLDSVKHYLYFLNAGFMAMNPENGHIKAWVGGINHKFFQYDHVNEDTKRQIGSTFKPFVYAAALENGIEPCDYISNERKVYENYDNWSPRNSNNVYEGFYSMEGGLTESVNTISVNLIMEIGPQKVVDLAKIAGIKSNISPVPSIALGTANISLKEMVSAYAIFATDGISLTPSYLLKIEDKNGKLLEEFESEQKNERAISKETSIMVREMLKSVINKGTASKLRYQYGLTNDIAGKTGTTQSHADGWFIGITPKLITGVWVGNDDPRIHFRTIQYGQGGHMALPIYGEFMKKVNKNKEFASIKSVRFPNPSISIVEAMDCDPFILEENNGLFDFLLNIGKNNENKDEDLERVRERHTPNKRKQQKKKKNIFDKIGDLFGN